MESDSNGAVEKNAPRVLFVHRRASGAQISIERLFGEIREALSATIRMETHVSPYPSRGLIPRLRNLIAAARSVPHDVVCHITGDVHYLALALPRARLVLTIHDCAILHRLHGWRRELVRYLWYEWPARRAAVVTTISETTRRDLARWLPKKAADAIRVIPNCVGREFGTKPRDFNRASPSLLQVGTGWNKNLEAVVEALDGTGFSLTVVGPVDADRQERLLESGANIEFLGKVDSSRLLRAYEECDAVVFASIFEGFGMPILEAQAVGRPLITSDRSAMPEVAGAGAIYVDPDDIGQIRSALIRIRDDPGLRESLISAGYRNVAKYRASVIAERYAEIYSELYPKFPSGS